MMRLIPFPCYTADEIGVFVMAEIYQIQVQGTIGQCWARWFEEMTIVTDDQASVTTLTGAVADQAALRGVLAKLWDLNLDLISIHRISREV
jgi:hypothetical protein